MKTTEPPVRVEQQFSCSAETLWNAITLPGEMTKWFFENIPDFKAEIGFHVEFPVHVEDRTFTHQWTVSEVSPKHKIVYRWKYAEYPGDSYVTFEINSINGVLLLTVTATVTEDFPDEVPEFRRESCLQGWEYFINLRLKEYLQS